MLLQGKRWAVRPRSYIVVCRLGRTDCTARIWMRARLPALAKDLAKSCCAGRSLLLLAAAAVQRPKRQPSCAAGWPVTKAGQASLGRLQRPAEVSFCYNFHCKLQLLVLFWCPIWRWLLVLNFWPFWPLTVLIPSFMICAASMQLLPEFWICELVWDCFENKSEEKISDFQGF